jgi:hypothetical protein
MSLESNDEKEQEEPNNNGGNEPRTQNDSLGQNATGDNGGLSSEVKADLNHITGSEVNIAAGSIIQIKVDSDKQARTILRDLQEESASRHVPSPPPADAPLQKKIDHWFEHELTNDREKFYAITLSIFNGVKYPDFKDIYEIILNVMEITDEESEDKPRSRFMANDEALFEKVKAQIVSKKAALEEDIEFTNPRYAAAIFDLMRRRYRAVLLDLLPALKQVVERYRYWEIRTRAAAAMAEIGKIAFHRVRNEVLDPWAGNPRPHIRASAGYPLARLAEDDTSRAAVIDLLENNWTNPRWHGQGESWRYRWTAASTYKQFGFIQADWVEEIVFSGLKKLAGFDDIRIADSVIHTLVVLSLQRELATTLLALKEWIEEGSAGNKNNTEPQARCIVAILAFMVVSEIHIEVSKEEDHETKPNESLGRVENLFDLVRQSEREQGDLWQLMVAVGVRSFEYRGLADGFFNLIARWTEYAADEPQLQNTIRNLLAEVFLIVRPRYRERILNRLNRWERQNRKKYLAEMARSTKLVIKERVLSEPLHGSPDDQVTFG